MKFSMKGQEKGRL